MVGFVIVLGASSGSVRAATESCAAGTTLNIVAHEDDDLLFLNPSVLHDVQCGRRVVTVYATAGDAGQDSSYWLGREHGARAAYAEMAGKSDSWAESAVTVSSHLLHVDSLNGDPNVTLVFMRLPDGKRDGTGFASSGYTSLKNLWNSSGPPYTYQLQPVDGSATYTRPQLVDVLTALMNQYKPDGIRTQDYGGYFGDNDHSDHHAIARFANLAQQQYRNEVSPPPPFTFTGYLGYTVSDDAQNVTGDDLTAKENAFFAYGAYDTDACTSVEACSLTEGGNEYLGWLQREYQIGMPLADAGSDQIVAAGSTVALAGSASSYPIGDSLSYFWTQTGGTPEVSLVDADTATPSFTAPADAATLTFALTVSDGALNSSNSVTITVTPLSDLSITKTDGSTSVNADSSTTYTIRVTNNGPSSVSGAILTDPSAAGLTKSSVSCSGDPGQCVSAPSIVQLESGSFALPTLSSGKYYEISVSAHVAATSGSVSNTASVAATVDDPTPANNSATDTDTVNHAPHANAGPDQTVNAGDTVKLDGSASSDPDGDILTYEWKQTGTPAVVLSAGATATPTFVAPANVTSLTFVLKVTNSHNMTATDSVTITVNDRPVANAGPDQSVSTGATVTLDGSASSDPDHNPITYKWEQTGGPTITLSSAVAAKPTFSAPAAAGTLVFTLTVSDGSLTSSDSVTITVLRPKHAPVADAGPDQSVSTGATVTLDGSASSDPDHNPITYKWEQTGGPTVTLSSAVAAKPSFTAPAGANTLTFKLTVSDGTLTSSDSVTIRVSRDAKPAAKRHRRPQTTLLKMKIRSAKRMVIFRFTGSGGTGKLSFQCRLDTQKFSRCRVYKTYKHLERGRHVFRVRARDASGLADLTLVTKRFKI